MCIIKPSKVLKKEGRESSLLQYTTMYHPFTEVSDLFNVIDLLRFHSLRTAGLVVFAHRPGTTAVFSYPGGRGWGGGGGRVKERTPGTHCLCMCLISEKSRKIGYFSNPPRNVDANFNFSCARVRPTSTVSMARRICECSNSPDARQVSFKHC